MFKTKIWARAPFDAADPVRLKAGPRQRRSKRDAAVPNGIEDVELFLRGGGYSG